MAAAGENKVEPPAEKAQTGLHKTPLQAVDILTRKLAQSSLFSLLEKDNQGYVKM